MGRLKTLMLVVGVLVIAGVFMAVFQAWQKNLPICHGRTVQNFLVLLPETYVQPTIQQFLNNPHSPSPTEISPTNGDLTLHHLTVSRDFTAPKFIRISATIQNTGARNLLLRGYDVYDFNGLQTVGYRGCQMTVSAAYCGLPNGLWPGQAQDVGIGVSLRSSLVKSHSLSIAYCYQ